MTATRWLLTVLLALLLLWTGLYAALRQGSKWSFGPGGVRTASVLGGGAGERAVEAVCAPLVWAELRLRSL